MMRTKNKFEGKIRIYESKKFRQQNGLKKQDKQTNNDRQNTAQKTKFKQHKPHSNLEIQQFMLHKWHPSCYSFKKSED